jgi:predicted phage terminase large subunit-like protein
MKIREELKKELARRSYADYCIYVHSGKWFLGKHLELICKTVEDLIFDRLKEQILILSVPPQHGKSQCVTETLPSYYLGKFPSKRVIETSYGDDLAQRFGRRNRDKINEFGFDLFDIKISKERNSATDFEIEGHKGSMISRGIMSGITGQPGDLIIIDDPIKNRQEADSETYRERLWDEFLNSIYTRLSAKGKIILIMTRWHEDDLAGRILKYMPDKALEINIPLEAEDNDVLGRTKGEALFPEIGKDNEWLREFKKAYMTKEGSRAWNALMQGHPTAQEGNMLKRHWWKFYESLPEWIDEYIQSWDCTFKDSDGSDFVVGQVWARAGAYYYLVDQFRDRMDLPTTMQAILNMSEKYPKATLKLVEDKANGPAVIQMLQTRLPGLIAINPEGGKITRASAVSPAIESGNVFLPNPLNNQWVNEFIEECSAFPSGAHDDMVDSMTQALNRLIYYSRSNKPEERRFPINSMEDRVQKNLEKLTSKKRRNDFL